MAGFFVAGNADFLLQSLVVALLMSSGHFSRRKIRRRRASHVDSLERTERIGRCRTRDRSDRTIDSKRERFSGVGQRRDRGEGARPFRTRQFSRGLGKQTE